MPPFPSYTLPPDKYIQAIEFAQSRHILHFGGILVSALVLLAILRFRLIPRIRNRPPALIVAALALLTALGDLPIDIYAHAVSLKYGISIEPWLPWAWDWTKFQLIAAVLAVFTAIPFYWLMRRAPARWWIYGWLASIPISLFGAFADPLVFEPLFHDFNPLAATHPALIEPIETMLARAGVAIPRDRLYEMQAARKTNALNAYVSGFGPSRRVVLYDTIIAKEPVPALLTTFGHELGHYVLRHIAKGLVFGSACTLIALYLLHRAIPWCIVRWGTSLGIQSVTDWASLPVFALAILAMTFLSEPILNAYSRAQEHEADLYSLHITRGIVPNPGQSAAQAFQIEGETDLEVPHPSPFIVFWLYSHPPVSDRLAEAARFVE